VSRGVCGTALEAQRTTNRGEAELREVSDHRDTSSYQVVEQPWKELVEDLRPSGHQQMGVPALWDARSNLRRLWERVAFEDRDSPVRVGQHPGGEKPGHAGPEDHRVVTDLRHLSPPAS
jgi:hypothetical protein